MRFSVARASLTARPLITVGVAGLLLALLGIVPVARASNCPNEGFRTGPGANLPDCRAYEMVTPPEKNGGEVDGGPILEGIPPSPEQAALNGEAVTYGSQTTFTEANPLSSPVTSQYISRRGPNGWYTQAITPEQNQPGGVFNREQGAVDFSLFHGFSEDLSHAFLVAYEPSPVAEAPAKYYNPYVRDNFDNSYRLLSKEKPPVQIPGISDRFVGFRVEYAGMSSDGSHVIFSANDKLTPGAVPGRTNLYEWSDGKLELVSVLPNGEAVVSPEHNDEGGGVEFGAFAFEQGGLNEDYKHAISADGSRVIWTGPSAMYVSELIAGGARIVHGPLPAGYQTASVDGSEVFYVSGGDLFRYELSSAGEGHSTDLTVDPTPGQSANVTVVLGASEDGSSVYFVAHGALAPGASSDPSSYNIYGWHDGVINLVAVTNIEDYSTGGGALFPGGGQNNSHGSLIGGPNNAEFLGEDGLTRVSPNGRYLAFESSRPLTGYDNKPLQAGICKTSDTSFSPILRSSFINVTDRCIEVYEYDAGTGRLMCVSCNPRGLPPVGNSVVPGPVHRVAFRAGWQTSTVQQRYLLDDGRVFFDSTDALLPQASNGRLNVYEYEPGGVGSCQREGGCLALISSGTSNEDSFFIDAGASGNDVFFLTRQQLVAQDGDEAVDVYDARVGGGFSPAVPPPCGGEACRPPVTPAPAIYGAPPSATFVGAGNPPQPAAGKAKKKARRKHKARKRTGRKAARGSRARGSSRGSQR